MVDQNDMLIREVNDAVRADRLQRFWRQYRWPVMVAAILLVLFTAGNSLWRHYQQQQAEAMTLAFAEAQGHYQREEFAKAVQFERDLQAAKASSENFASTPFLHKSCIPLDKIDFRSDIDHGQMTMWDDECEGMCGV